MNRVSISTRKRLLSEDSMIALSISVLSPGHSLFIRLILEDEL